MVTGISNSSVNTSLKIYPNPTSGVFKLNKAMEYRVFNSFGQIILSDEGSQVDLNYFNRGVYTLQAGTSSLKIITQ